MTSDRQVLASHDRVLACPPELPRCVKCDELLDDDEMLAFGAKCRDCSTTGVERVSRRVRRLYCEVDR